MRITKNPRSWPSLSLAVTACLSLCCLFALGWTAYAQSHDDKQQTHQQLQLGDSQQDAEDKSKGCKSCHASTDNETMHPTNSFKLGCTSCHGGDARVMRSPDIARCTDAYDDLEEKAHKVVPRSELHSSRNRERAYTDWMKRSKEYVQFVNPGDLRVADQTCGGSSCHSEEVHRVRTSMMTHGAMLWSAALYNNGAYPFKNARFGESYDSNGNPQAIFSVPQPNEKDTHDKGILPRLDPLQRWEVSQPGNVLRVFERGGGPRTEVGNPQEEDQPGRPDAKLSDRGFGTLLRTDPVFLGLQKTRLFDPLLSFPGTNDHPGDYRGSGCTACHVIYANDRDQEHSGLLYANRGNQGQTATIDSTIRQSCREGKEAQNEESGHPIQHIFTKVIPSSQCMVCHVHPGTNMVASYFGDTWWDNEVDGDKMYPPYQKNPTEQEYHDARERNPEGSAAKGLWNAATKKGAEFLSNVGQPKLTENDHPSENHLFNEKLNHTQFDDFHSHGWIFRKVYKQDRYGNLLDKDDKRIGFNERDRFQRAVPLKDIHLEKGMHCIDCHFNQDVHGNRNLYGETRAAIEIACIDCHGTIQNYATLSTSGPAAPEGGTKMQAMRTPWQELRFYWKNNKLFQRSSVEKGQEWEVVQVKDVIDPNNDHYNYRARVAKLLGKDGGALSDVPSNPDQEHKVLAHPMKEMTCVSCHSSWTTTCFGCHLPMTANQRMPMLHNEGTMTRNWVEYDFQVLRHDMYMLGIDGTVTGNKVAPIRSACAVVVSSQNQNRDWIYYGQQTISAEGFSGTAFSPYVPHTVRAKETRGCTDCHLSSQNDNNAWMAQLLLQGTNFLNYLGRYAYVANGNKGFSAIAFAELKEPEAVIGSDFHKIAYKDNYIRHTRERKLELKEAYEHAGRTVHDVQLRGEYLYAAMGKGGLRIYDVANIENKDFSERMITAPVSRLGQRFYVHTKDAWAVAAPSTTAIDPTRKHFPVNEEQEYEKGKGHIPLMYGFLYVADKEEGLVVIGTSPPKDDDTPANETAASAKKKKTSAKYKKPVGVSTLLDGEPRNNFLQRATLDLKDERGKPLGSFLKGEFQVKDAEGKLVNKKVSLAGAHRITIAGHYAYILCDAGLVVVDLENPLGPRITALIGAPELKNPRGIGIQFRYGFVVDDDGMKVLDVTHLDQPRLVPGVNVPFADARNITVSRTYAYIAAGKEGMGIVDIEKPEHPILFQRFTANGKPKDPNDALQDTNDIKVGMVSSSQFALVADGKAGFKVVQLFSPDTSPGFYGFAPGPHPVLIAKYHTHGEALAVSRGVDRDRAVDENGRQLSVFGRRGSRPFNEQEMRKMYICNQDMALRRLCNEGEVYTVTDDPSQPIATPAGQTASGNLHPR